MTLTRPDVTAVGSDDEMDEDETLPSDHGDNNGECFHSSTKSSMEQRHVTTTNKVNKFLCIEVNTQRDSNSEEIIGVDVAAGMKMTLFHSCVDTMSSDFVGSAAAYGLKLLMRCCYNSDQHIPWMCLCYYSNLQTVPPSTTLGMEIVGPCTVEWKIEGWNPVLTFKRPFKITIFGQMTTCTEEISNGCILVARHGTILLNSPVVDSSSVTINKENRKEQTISNDWISDKLEKRKLEQLQEDPGPNAEQEIPISLTSQTDNGSSTKLTKKQRLKLANEKAKQLEEALSAKVEAVSTETNTEETTSKKKKKKKKKKKPLDVTEVPSQPTSLTSVRRLPDGILVRDILVGTGTAVSSGRRISLNYTGTLKANGKVFDKNHSKSQPLQFRQGTGEVIRGLERGLEGMKVGGERSITIPASLGYGDKGMGQDIPPNSDLVFEVKVLKVG